MMEIDKSKIKLKNNFPRKIERGSEAIFKVIEVFCSSSFTKTLERPREEEKNRESKSKAENISGFSLSGILWGPME